MPSAGYTLWAQGPSICAGQNGERAEQPVPEAPSPLKEDCPNTVPGLLFWTLNRHRGLGGADPHHLLPGGHRVPVPRALGCRSEAGATELKGSVLWRTVPELRLLGDRQAGCRLASRPPGTRNASSRVSG